MAKKISYAQILKQQKAEAAKEAARIQPLLSKDPNWEPVTSGVYPKTRDEEKRRLRAITGITKKAVRTLYPNYTCNVRRDRGTAHGWVMVDIKMPELEWRKKQIIKEVGGYKYYEYKEVCRRVKDILVALGIKYGSYTPDFGPGMNDPEPCLSVTVNGYG